jgi:hypothetical protein
MVNDVESSDDVTPADNLESLDLSPFVGLPLTGKSKPAFPTLTKHV